MVVTPIEEPQARNNDWYILSQQTQTVKTSSTANSIITTCLSNFRPNPVATTMNTPFKKVFRFKPTKTAMTSHTDRA